MNDNEFKDKSINAGGAAGEAGKLPPGGDSGYKSGYYLQLSEEFFKYSFFLLFIVFGALYYRNYILPPDYSPVKAAGLFFLIYFVFGIFYILLPLKRMLFSNLQIYRKKLNLNSKYEQLVSKAVSHTLQNHDASAFQAGAKSKTAALITCRTDYYVAFAPFFLSLCLSVAAFSVFSAVNENASAVRSFNLIAAAYLLIGFVAALTGFRHFINRPDSTHRGFLLLILVLNSFFSVSLCVNFPLFAHYKNLLAIVNLIMLGYFLYCVLYKDDLTAFVRTPDRNIYVMSLNSAGGAVHGFEKIEFGTICKFVQTPFAIGFTIYEREDETGFGGLYYCDTSKEALEKVLEVFSDRIAEKGETPAAEAGVPKNSVNFFEPLSVAALARKYGSGQTLVLLAINIVSAAMFYEIFMFLAAGK
ncbi:MAG: hypothetical protein A2008_08725 [Candidatus Wallbacteria bacterium GWC2_49_35]|uniref:Uncharacterized protein n=1 Tax=Candidatus Wallbacteria bacterium GWC2_49_35 TaxID=1817813 RepID=A0A1F7WME4_9BACT|nr:MAG: hypothetical protein A2008_08725 [Candidatus Wallbacteria bacterium GWC2_49_35]